jgi:hypothetical protein
MTRAIDRFLPEAEVRERFETLVRAPAPVVFRTAEQFRIESIAVVRGIFRLRARLMGTRHRSMRKGLVEETLALGWGKLSYTPGRELAMGAVTRPWLAEVRFRAVPPDCFAEFGEPDTVKIVWTLEAEPLGPALTRFRHETRVLATDEGARHKFRSYWRRFGIGILLIRRLVLPAIRREAERRYREEGEPEPQAG